MPEGSADFINQLFAGLNKEDRQFLDRFLTLQEKVKEGTATIQEELEFEGKFIILKSLFSSKINCIYFPSKS